MIEYNVGMTQGQGGIHLAKFEYEQDAWDFINMANKREDGAYYLDIIGCEDEIEE